MRLWQRRPNPSLRLAAWQECAKAFAFCHAEVIRQQYFIDKLKDFCEKYFGIGSSAAFAGMEQETAGSAPFQEAIFLVAEDCSPYCNAGAGESLRH